MSKKNKKYLVVPGYIKSISDGDIHWITANQLISLYGVDRQECVISEPDPDYGEWMHETLKVLRPRYDGNYKI